MILIKTVLTVLRKFYICVSFKSLIAELYEKKNITSKCFNDPRHSLFCLMFLEISKMD